MKRDIFVWFRVVKVFYFSVLMLSSHYSVGLVMILLFVVARISKAIFPHFFVRKRNTFFAMFFVVDCKLLICHCVWEFKHLYFCCVLFVVLFLCLFLCLLCLCVCLYLCLFIFCNSRVVIAHVSKLFISIVKMLICG